MKSIRVASLLFAGLAAVPAAAQSGLYFSEDNNGKGLYGIDTRNGAITPLGASGVTGMSVGLAPTASTLDLYGSSPRDLNRIKTDGSGAGTIGSGNCEGMAYHRSTDTLYAAIDGAFFTLDTSVGGVVTKLPNPTGLDFEALAFDQNRGIVWALPGNKDRNTKLWYYTPTTGKWETWMDTGIDWDHPGLAYDPKADLLYAKDTVTSALLALDPISKSFYKVGDTTLNTGGGLALIPQGLSLEADLYDLKPGSPFTLTLYDGMPGLLGAFVVVEVSGTPMFRIVGRAKFNNTGTAALQGTVPSGLSGLDADLIGLGFVGPRMLDRTNQITINFL